MIKERIKIKHSPVDISKDNVKVDCLSKCVYNYKYPLNSVMIIKHESYFISVKPETSSISTSPPVTYNAEEYVVNNVVLFSPSVHLFNNLKVDAEIMIQHVSDIGKTLFVCIPVLKSSTTSLLLSQIISNTSSKAAGINDTATVNLSPSVSLDSLIPPGSFFTYTGKYGEIPSDFIAYGKSSSSVSISEGDLATLTEMIKAFPLPMLGGWLYENPKGANLTKGTNEIYIDCKSTGSSAETTDVVVATTTSDDSSWTSWSSDTKNKIWLACIISAFVIIVAFSVRSFYNTINPGSHAGGTANNGDATTMANFSQKWLSTASLKNPDGTFKW